MRVGSIGTRVGTSSGVAISISAGIGVSVQQLYSELRIDRRTTVV